MTPAAGRSNSRERGGGQEPDLVDLLAAAVDEPDVQRIPARTAPQDGRAVRPRQVGVAPLLQGSEHDLQLATGVGEPVLLAGPAALLAVRLARQHAVRDEGGEA